MQDAMRRSPPILNRNCNKSENDIPSNDVEITIVDREKHLANVCRWNRSCGFDYVPEVTGSFLIVSYRHP